ncbi:MAG: toll/interleukin-1 receptor domain-containing protein [Gammaproteobacteria bacterium]|nr:toll/interleukin-1 receptor domain-containing protein [Gammaproteobacteria bacterium]
MAKPEHQELIHQGAPRWNEWRAQHPHVQPDLSGIRISSDVGGVDARSAQLRAADLQDVDLRDIELRGANLYRANLQHADLRGQRLAGANLSGANLEGANLEGADLRGALLTEASLQHVNLSHANLSRANFRGADLTNATMVACTVHGALFTQANLSLANLADVDLRQANVSEANFGRATLTGADLRYVDLSSALVARSDLAGAKVEGAHFPKHIFAETRFLVMNQSQARIPPPSTTDSATSAAHHVPLFELYGRASVVPGAATCIDVWAYLPEQFERVLRYAEGNEALPESVAQTLIAGDIPLTLDLHVPGIELGGSTNLLIWRGRPARSSFPLLIPRRATPGKHTGTLEVRACGMRICTIVFSLTLDDWEATKVVSLTAGCSIPRKAYASFVEEDRQAVEQRLRLLMALVPGLQVNTQGASRQDWSAWRRRMEHDVARDDAFYLFWSKRSAHSLRLTKEWEYALGRRGLSFIDPVPLDDPALVRPPPVLRSLRFDEAFQHAWQYAPLVQYF